MDILGSEADDVNKDVDPKIEKSKMYRNLDVFLSIMKSKYSKNKQA